MNVASYAGEFAWLRTGSGLRSLIYQTIHKYKTELPISNTRDYADKIVAVLRERHDGAEITSKIFDDKARIVIRGVASLALFENTDGKISVEVDYTRAHENQAIAEGQSQGVSKADVLKGLETQYLRVLEQAASSFVPAAGEEAPGADQLAQAPSDRPSEQGD